MPRKTTKQSKQSKEISSNEFKGWVKLNGLDPENISLINSDYDYLDAYKKTVYIYACIKRIASDVASLPIKLCKHKNKEVVEVEDHPLLTMLKYANSRYSSYDLIEDIVSNLCITGNSYNLLDGQGRNPKTIIPIIPANVTIEKDKSTNEIKYKMYSQADNYVTIEAGNMFHVKFFDPLNKLLGMSPIRSISKEYETDMRAKLWNLYTLINGGTIDGVLETDKNLISTTVKRLQKSFNDKYLGAENTRKVPVLDNGLKWKSTGMSPKDMEFLDQIKLTRSDIFMAFGMYPIMLGILENANYSNSKEQNEMYWINTIPPYLRKIESAINEFLLPQYTNSSGMFVKFDINSIPILQEINRKNEEHKISMVERLVTMGVPYNLAAKKYALPVQDVLGLDKGRLPFNLVEVGFEAKKEGASNNLSLARQRKNIFALSENMARNKWEKFIKIATNIETEMKKPIIYYFDTQSKIALQIINKYKSFMKKTISDEDINKIARELRDAFNSKENVDNWYKKLKPYYKEALFDQALNEVENFDLGITFDINTPEVDNWITQRSGSTISQINNTTLYKLRDELQTGVSNGEGIPQLSERISESMNIMKDYRTIRIARTETISASNQGALESYRQSNINMGKGWLAAFDERTRDTHIQASAIYNDQNPLPLDVDFIVGSGTGPAPGQINEAGESVNCRCTVIPVFIE
ncbi:phage portal protein [Patescibacteria group bacterium]|nr:phage portal protein [Patescibacteria group bacterium]